MKIKIIKDPFEYRKFSIKILKSETDLLPIQVCNQLRRITKIKWKVSHDVSNKFQIESEIIRDRKIRKRWKDREIEILKPKGE